MKPTITLERIELGPEGIRFQALIPWQPKATIDTEGEPTPPPDPGPAQALSNVVPFRRAS
jgi:hypothetical protein